MKPRVRRLIKQRHHDPLWFKDAVFYQLRIASFADSDGDGIGDFRGALSKLDYLHRLGVNTLWMLPFYPSPGRDDGYDIADYGNIAAPYGTLDDFRAFLDAARARDMHVITELVINHTSDQHAWFQRARRAPKGSPERDFYVWADDTSRYSDVRIIFGDYEPSNWTWDALAGQFYWHRFFHHQPDLNFDNPLVHEAVLGALDFWLDMGVDGVRLDAIPYLYEREGTNGESLPETHAFIKKMRAHVEARYPGKVLLAEANQWPEAMADYFGAGDECNMAFHFPIMPRLYLAMHQQDRAPIIDILAQTPAIPENCQWALFLRNHDELTLEMVTDEEREAMRRAYAPEKPMRINLGIRRRLAPMFHGDRRALEVMNAMLFSLPGTPIVYYGDEIGMGDNVYLPDRNGVRTPMQWSADRNAGFSTANPQSLLLPPITDPAFHYQAVNVELQEANPASLLAWMTRLIGLRRRFKAFGRGTITFLNPANPAVLAYLRRWRDEAILVVVNLSRTPQSAALSLGEFAGVAPIELFGGTAFPPIASEAYPLALAGHSFYWFELPSLADADADPPRPAFTVAGSWSAIFDPALRPELTHALAAHLLARPSLAARADAFEEAALIDRTAIAEVGALALVRLRFSDAADVLCLLPLAFAPQGADLPGAALADLHTGAGDGTLYEPAEGSAWWGALAAAIGHGHTLAGEAGRFAADRVGAGPLNLPGALTLLPMPDPGLSPALELGRFLAEHAPASGPLVPPLIGALEYHPRGPAEPITLALLHAATPASADLETMLRARLAGFFAERLAAGLPAPALSSDLAALAAQGLPDGVVQAMGDQVALARALGQRAADLHAALAAPTDQAAFKPEPFTLNDGRSLYQSLHNLAAATLRQAEAARPRLPDSQAAIDRLLALEARLLPWLKAITGHKLGGQRIRLHGDLSLRHVLRTPDGGLMFTGLGGDAAFSVDDRRLKRSPLRDVARLLHDLDQVAWVALAAPHDQPLLAGWARAWGRAMSVSLLMGYIGALLPLAPGLLPATEPLRRLLFTRLLAEDALLRLSQALASAPTPGLIDLFTGLLIALVEGIDPDATA